MSTGDLTFRRKKGDSGELGDATTRKTVKQKNIFPEVSCKCFLHEYRYVYIGADFHRAMVASAPGRITHVGRRPMRNWISDMNSPICSQENERKLLPPELHTLTHAPNRLSAGASPQTPLGGAYSAPPKCLDPLPGFSGPISKGTAGGRPNN